MPDLKLPRPAVATVLAAALLAAACGSGDGSDADVTAADEPTTEASASSEEPTTDEPSAEDAPAEEAEEAADVGPHLFPELTTVNVADGSTLNLATELAGGDTPVLLWFYAPH